MKVIIVEDEPTAVNKLVDILGEISQDIEVAAILPSVRETLQWLDNHTQPDLGFFDIQLADDISFEIFQRHPIEFPVIFTTAFDNYLLKAFEYHSVHYLLKPLQKDKVSKAVSKVNEWKKIFTTQSVLDLINQKNSAGIRNRFIVRKGNEFIPILTSQIAYFFTDHGLFFAKTFEDETFMIDMSLSEIENQVDTKEFFRANRQFLVHISSIEKFRSIEQSKIKLELTPKTSKEILIGKQNAIHFRKWITQN